MLGAGLGGVIMAYEMRDQLRKGDKLTVISKEAKYHFVPSNPWVAVNWRTREEVEIDLTRTFAKRKIHFMPIAAKGVTRTKTASSWRTARGSITTFSSFAQAPNLPSMKSRGLDPTATPSPSATPITHRRHPRPSRHSVKTPARSLPALYKGRRASGQPTSTPSFSTPNCAASAPRPRADDVRHPRALHRPPGLDGVGNTKGLLEAEMRDHHIKWITNARAKTIEPGKMVVEEVTDDGELRKVHELPFAYSMVLPAFRGIAPLRGIDGLVNPRGLRPHRQDAAHPKLPQHLLRWRLRRDSSYGPNASPLRRAEAAS